MLNQVVVCVIFLGSQLCFVLLQWVEAVIVVTLILQVDSTVCGYEYSWSQCFYVAIKEGFEKRAGSPFVFSSTFHVSEVGSQGG